MIKLRLILIFFLFKIFFSTYAIASDLDPKTILNNVLTVFYKGIVVTWLEPGARVSDSIKM